MQVVQMAKKRRKAKRKGFAILLQKPEWFVLIASMHYQATTEEVEGLQALIDFFEATLTAKGIKIGDAGNKTIRVPGQHVTTAKVVLQFATSLHRQTGWGGQSRLSLLGKKFSRELGKINDVSTIDLLGDIGRQAGN